MNELIEVVSARTGMPQGVAKVAVETVVTYLKVKVPSPIWSYIDSALSSGADLIPKGLGEALGKNSNQE